MDDQEFIERIYEFVVEANSKESQEIFSSKNPDEVKNSYWKKALRLYSSLNDNDQKILLEIVRQNIVDTCSNILGILDGSCDFGVYVQFELRTQGQKDKINGDLQQIFLSMDDEKSEK